MRPHQCHVHGASAVRRRRAVRPWGGRVGPGLRDSVPVPRPAMHYSSYERRAANELGKQVISTLRVFSGLVSPGGCFSEPQVGGHTSKENVGGSNLPSSLCIICHGAFLEICWNSRQSIPDVDLKLKRINVWSQSALLESRRRSEGVRGQPPRSGAGADNLCRCQNNSCRWT